MKISPGKRAALRGPCLGQHLCGVLHLLGGRGAGLRLQPVEIVGAFWAWLTAVQIARFSSFRTFTHDAILGGVVVAGLRRDAAPSDQVEACTATQPRCRRRPARSSLKFYLRSRVLYDCKFPVSGRARVTSREENAANALRDQSPYADGTAASAPRKTFAQAAW
jgi:hypothetical protein